MPDIVTIENLTEVMIFHLTNLQTALQKDNPPIVVDGNTIHSAVLSDTDQFPPSNSKNVYKAFVIDTLIENGHKVKLWPSDWMNLSVNDLAAQII